MRKKVWLSVFVAQIMIFGGWCQSERSVWVDSTLRAMDLSEKIGQLIMIQSNGYDIHDIRDAEDAINSFDIGGIVFTGGGPTVLARLTEQLNRNSKIPLLFGVNASEGLGATIDSTLVFPSSIMMGALRNDSLLYYAGRQVGRSLRELGLQICFGPTVDLSSSFQLDELINRTYGDNKENVASKSVLFMKGLQDIGIIPVAKYYSNSRVKVSGFRKGTPIVKNEEDPDKLYVVRKISEAGCPGILCASRQEPIFPNKRIRLSKRNKKVSTSVPALYTAQYLKESLDYQGLIFSYVPDVQPVLKKKFRNGDSEVFAFKAGNDILLSPKNIRAAIRKLRREIRNDASLVKKLDRTVSRVLGLKYDALISRSAQNKVESSATQVNAQVAARLLQDIFEQSITVAKNVTEALPIKILDNRKFACLSIGNSSENTFSRYVSKYTAVDCFKIQNLEDTTNLMQKLHGYDVVIAGVFTYASTVEEFYVPILNKLENQSTLITILFTSPTKTSLIDNLSTIVEAYVDDDIVQRIAPQIVFGALPSTATMPLTINQNVRRDASVQTAANGRLGYARPWSVGIDEEMLKRVDDIAREAIDSKATPGCQILIARKGRIIYEKSFGWQTYEQKVPITDETIYDLASVTKVAATMQGIMFLYDRGLVDINKKISYYLPELVNSNKKDITIKDILTHQAGLWPFLPFWMQTKKDTVFMPQFYNKARSDSYPFQVAPNLFAVQSMRDSIWTWIVQSKMREKAPRTPYNYTYSDIGLYLMFRLNEKLLNQNQDEFLNQNLYEPLGAKYMGYLPLARFQSDRIAPTENDKLFRNELLVGTVHDEGAAMNGGVAGHAGLFGTATDMAKLGQMMLQHGYYGGIQYYKPETVKLFTAQQFETSRRGLGWDRPVTSDWNTPASVYASPKTFGHTGFTGTCIWVDPEFELVYIFLSNRVYPTRNENKLSSLNIRSRIQDTIYKAIFNYCQYENPETWTKSK